MRMNLDHVASDHFVHGRDVLCEFDYWPLAYDSTVLPYDSQLNCFLSQVTLCFQAFGSKDKITAFTCLPKPQLI